jgi:AmmeMemoRadiSam system protein B
LRPLELKWLDDGPDPVLFMRDPSGIAPISATVPRWVAFLLSLCDGERDLGAIRAAFELRTGQSIPRDRLEDLFRQLDESLFLESPHFYATKAATLRAYREAAFRPPALADRVYPSRPAALLEAFDAYGGKQPGPAENMGTVRGVVSPHIDYQRGGPIYAETWSRAARAVNDAEIVVIFGTDHAGGAGKLTLTRQSYATPLGILPTTTDVVDAVAAALGEDDAFEEELHHRGEHSIELASVWLHRMRTGAPPEIVPILCGSFYPFTNGGADPADDERFGRALGALADATDGRRVLVVAAADLAHVGPAFGDEEPLDLGARARLQDDDRALLDTIVAGDAGSFVGQLRAEGDRRRICGLPPIYLMLRLLGSCKGNLVDYDQCPADANGGSLVSIAGVLLE